MSNDFNFFVPIDEQVIEKAAQAPIEKRYDNMELYGRASDNTEDIDGEVLEPNGYVLDTFLKGGIVNFEHLAKKSPKFIIGHPVEAKVKNNEFFVKAKLWKSSEIARDLWDKLIEMKQDGINRMPGWSVEGKALSRDPMNPKHITKALLTNIAITFSPVNQNSWADIVKGIQKEDFIEPEYEKKEVLDYLFEFENKGKKYRVDKDFKIYEVGLEKAIDTTAVAPMTPESLDKDVKNIALSDIKKAIDTVIGNEVLMRTSPDLKNILIDKLKSQK